MVIATVTLCVAQILLTRIGLLAVIQVNIFIPISQEFSYVLGIKLKIFPDQISIWSSLNGKGHDNFPVHIKPSRSGTSV